MYKTLLMAVALIAPVLAQDASDGPRGPKHQGPRDMGRNILAHKLVMDKYDTNKDGKLDDTEKAALKADADKLREARHKEMLAKWDKDGDGKLSDEEKEAMKTAVKAEREKAMKERAESRKDKKDDAKADGDKEGRGKRGERGDRGPRGPRGGRPGGDMMIVGQALVMEKYDTDKDGKLSKDERDAMKSCIEAARKETKDAKPADAPELPPAPED